MQQSKIWHEWVSLVPELNGPKVHALLEEISQKRRNGITIYPKQNLIFAALNHCAPQDISVIILGQDPYHGANQAHGLAFSVSEPSPPPPSLKNIFKEIKNDIYNGQNIKFSSDLTYLAKQGVLLLNCILTVEQAKPLSHQKLGWQEITTSILSKLSLRNEALAVLLWGKSAHGYSSLFNNPNHFILKAAHPSPLSASRGFLGCKHFSKTNEFLLNHHKPIIQW